MSGLMALRLARGGERSNVEILRALAYDNQTSNFSLADVVTGLGAFAVGILTAGGNPTGSAASIGTLTGTTISATNTVVIDGITYTFIAALSTGPIVANEILLGAADTDSLDNLIAAINGAAGEGVLYSVGTTPQTLVSARPGAGDTMIVDALTRGVAGDAITTTDTLAAGGWAGGTLASGVDGDDCLIGTQTYTFAAAPLDNQANQVLVGAAATNSLDNLIAAINAAAGAGTLYGTGTVGHPDVTAAAGGGDTIDLTADVAGTAGNAIATVCDPTTRIDFGAATLTGGVAASGAVGTLTEQVDAGATGTLQLRDVVGEYNDNERIGNGASADGLVNGQLAVPLLTPSDACILQVDAVDIERGEAIEMISYLRAAIMAKDWHGDNGLFALRIVRGGQVGDVENLGSLAFDGQSVNFTVGQTITGGTSLATGNLVEQVDAGASGTLTMSDIAGIFQNNDVLTDEGSGDGDAVNAQIIPLLTPADSMIFQIDGAAETMTKSAALEILRQIRGTIYDMDWPHAA